MDNDKLPEQEIVPQSKFSKWLDNFWFYHKWHLIIGLFVAFVLIIGLVQMATKENPDVIIMYAGPLSSTISEEEDVRNAFNSVIPVDYNNDGKKYTQLAMITIFSEEQIAQKYKDAQERGEEIIINTSTNASELQKYDNLIAAGEYSICLVDPWLYERVKVANGFRKLSDVLGKTPENAYDEYAIKLSETEFGKYFSSLGVFPEDTLLCLRLKGTMSTFLNKNSDEEYAHSVDVFRAIINFKYPEGYVPKETQ